MKRDDFKIYRRLVSDLRIAHAARFQPAKDLSSAKRLFRDDLSNAKSDAVTLDSKMIGMISMYPTVGQQGEPDNSCLELADLMLPRYQNHGYMDRALGMLINKLERHSGVHKLMALVNEHNIPSRKVLIHNHFVSYRSVLNMASGSEDLVYQRGVKH